MLAGNARQVHVTAPFAMHVPDVPDRNRPGVKARVAGSATPGTQTCQSRQVVLSTSSAGTAGTIAMTDRTQQNLLPSGNAAKRIRKDLLQWQVPSAQIRRSMYNETTGASDGGLRCGPGPRRFHATRQVDHDDGITLAKKHPSAQIVDNPVRVGDNHS